MNRLNRKRILLKERGNKTYKYFLYLTAIILDADLQTQIGNSLAVGAWSDVGPMNLGRIARLLDASCQIYSLFCSRLLKMAMRSCHVLAS
jgi:hypothetical protein